MGKTKLVRILAEGERYGVFESGSVYNQHAIARILGLAESHGNISRRLACSRRRVAKHDVRH